jgi:hypothetical protein
MNRTERASGHCSSAKFQAVVIAFASLPCALKPRRACLAASVSRRFDTVGQVILTPATLDALEHMPGHSAERSNLLACQPALIFFNIADLKTENLLFKGQYRPKTSPKHFARLSRPKTSPKGQNFPTALS